MEDLNKILQSSAQNVLDTVKWIVNNAPELGQQNEQWFLDWLDKLNEYSVRY